MDTILLVGIEPSLGDDLSLLLREEGCTVDTAPEGVAALHLLGEKDYHLAVVDFSAVGGGEGFVSGLRNRFPRVDIMILAEDSAVDDAVRALAGGACDLLVKPVGSDACARRIRMCREKRRLREENEALKRQVALYRATQTISTCLDLDKIGSLVVSALVTEGCVSRGLGVFVDEEGLFSLKGMGDMDEGSARALAELVMSGYQRRTDRGERIVQLNDFVPDDAAHAFAVRADLREALVVGIYTRSVLQGIVALFNDPGVTLPRDLDRHNLEFLADHSARALENATRYTNARNLINIDELTGLFNYRYLETALDREIKRAERYRSSLAIVFLDLDQFKEVNDTHGHLVGSKVLREIGILLKSLVREVDTVIRYGGDEYTIILVESTNLGAARVAERIRSAVEARSFLTEEGLNIRLTASLGYACYPDDSQSYVELLQMADQAMYRGKFSGRNVVFHIGQAKRAQENQGD